MLVIVLAGLVLYYFPYSQKAPHELSYKIIDIGNPSLEVSIIGPDPENEDIPHNVRIVDKRSGKSIIADNINPYHMIINDHPQSDKYIIADFGTSNVRHTKIYDADTGVERIAFCNLGFGVYNDYILYTDCNTDPDFEFRSAVIENGQYNPFIHKLNLDTLENEVVLQSDKLHKYAFTQHPKNNYNITVTSVEKFADWSDFSKWKESHLTVK